MKQLYFNFLKELDLPDPNWIPDQKTVDKFYKKLQHLHWKERANIKNLYPLAFAHQLFLSFSKKKQGGLGRKKKSFFKNKDIIPCVYCQKALCFHEATVEHITPRCQGGSNRKANLAIACAPCNNRNNIPFQEWKTLTLKKVNLERKFYHYKIILNIFNTKKMLIENKYLS